jgi:L-methionine (R)-S-oxide reductase
MQTSPDTQVASFQVWLQQYLKDHGGIAGSVHRLEPTSELLQLVAHVNLPPPVVNITREIPKGKGMAGLAWERLEPVQTCNLQQPNPDVRPGARAVNAQAAAAIPVVRHGQFYAVVGIAFMGERELEGAELQGLVSAAELVP